MNTNADITIFNKWYNEDTRLDEWYRTQIPGVNWYGGQAVTVSDNGLMAANTYKVRIPLSAASMGKTFVNPQIYAVKAKTDLSDCWTLQSGDVVARGLVDVADPKDVSGEHFLVTGWNDNRRGSPIMQHWRVDGK